VYSKPVSSSPFISSGLSVTLTWNSSVEVWVDEVLRDGNHLPADPPAGYEVLTCLVGYGWFTIPPDTTDLSIIDIYCMKVIE